MKNIFTINGVESNLFQIGITVAAIFLFLVLKAIISRIVTRHAKKYAIDISRQIYIKKLINYLLFVIILVLVAGIWEISFKGLSLGFASVFTILGVALFAHWSILSNLTSSIILYFFFPYRIGGNITILEGDKPINGRIMDIKLFYIDIKTQEGHLVSIPNNLAFQKIIRYE